MKTGAMMTHTRLLVAVLAVAALSAHAFGATIASYDFSIDDSSSDSEANSTAQDFGAGAGGFDQAARSSGSANYFTRNAPTSFSASTGYVGFTVDADNDYRLDLTQLSFGYVAQSSSNAGAYTTTFSLRTSADGFASDVAGTYSNNPVNASVTTGVVPVTETATFDLSGAAFQGLDSLEVRIYQVNSVAANGAIVRVDNVELTGDVALIPEPGSLVLLTMAGLGLVAYTRHKKA